MKKIVSERRKYPRYDTEIKIYFHVKYTLETKVKFEVLEEGHESRHGHKYSGFSKDVSAEGLGFISRKRLEEGDVLYIEVYEPKVKRPVKMEGEVRWSRKLPEKHEGKNIYHTGVRLISVNGKPVVDTIYFDKKYKILWSAVLDAMFGSFAAALKKVK